MDVCESEQGIKRHTQRPAAVETPRPRPPLAPAEKNNAPPPPTATRRPRIREVSSRYKSPTPSRPSSNASTTTIQRCPSPNAARTALRSSPISSPRQLAPKRSVSADRKRPSTPPSPPSPSTPVRDSNVDHAQLARRNGRLPEGLWPSTMRSLSVSFQSDSISIPVSKKERAVSSALSERTLRSSSNVASPAAPRKVTPERKRSPLRGKNVSDQSENSRPVDSLHSRLIDQHRWPSRIGGKVSSNSSSMNRSLDLGPPRIGRLVTPSSGIAMRRTMPGGDATMQFPSLPETGRAGLGGAKSADESSLHKLISSSFSERLSLKTTPGVRSLSRPSSPSKTAAFASSVSRGCSPSRSRPTTPPSRGVSPSKARASSTCSQSTSVLSFIADFKGKKSAGYVEDAHQLRLLHNRFLQWRFANARAEAVLYIQKVTAERTLFNVLNTTMSLWDSVMSKRIELQQLKLELKLNSVLNDQMDFLDDWALLERDHIDAFTGAMEDLEASTLRLPVTGGARADIDSLKVAICSAVDVMQAMGSSICSLLSRVEGVNSLVSELAVVAAEEKAMLDECEALLTSATVMQIEEYSLRTHFIQLKQDMGRVSSQFWPPQPRHLDPD